MVVKVPYCCGHGSTPRPMDSVYIGDTEERFECTYRRPNEDIRERCGIMVDVTYRNV